MEIEPEVTFGTPVKRPLQPDTVSNDGEAIKSFFRLTNEDRTEKNKIIQQKLERAKNHQTFDGFGKK